MSGYKIGMAEEAVIADLTAKLVESQAREAKLRDALKVLMSAPFDYPDDEYQQDKLAAAMSDANKLLNQPHEDAALKEYCKKVLLEAADWFDKDAGVYGMDSMWSLSGEKLRRMAEE